MKPLRVLSFGISAFLLLSGSLCVSGASASIAAVESQVQSDLRQVTNLELPATAARLVRAAYGDDRETTALAIVREISKVNAPALPSVIGAMTRVQPSLGPKLAQEASRLRPNLSSRVQLAVSAAAPKPTAVSDPKPTTRSTTTQTTSAAATGPITPTAFPDPQPTPDHGKKKGHYKRPQGP